MIRQPTPQAALYEWHRVSLIRRRAGLKPLAIHGSEPQCGWFRRRMVKNGPWVPAVIWCEQDIDPETGELAADETLRCTLGLDPVNPFTQWLRLANNPISREHYDDLLDRHRRERAMQATLAPVENLTDLGRRQ